MEILIASVILVAILIPVLSLLFGGRQNQQEEVMMTEAISIASNIMEQIISENVPFSAIKPDGGGTLVPAWNGIRQAGFEEARLQSILGTPGADPSFAGQQTYVTKGKRGNDYMVYFFAGKYPDDPQVADAWENSRSGGPGNYTRPDFDNSLTFLYVPNPARRGVPFNFNATDSVMNNQVILSTPATTTALPASTVPYTLESYRISRGSTTDLGTLSSSDPYFFNDPQNSTLITGWPLPARDPGGAGWNLRLDTDPVREEWMTKVQDTVTSGGGGSSPTIGYHPRVLDQATWRLINGAYMKVIVGVKFNPHAFSTSTRRESGNFREFWLVSFKAKLEDN